MIVKSASLTPEIVAIVHGKGTEYPFTGRFDDFAESGTYLCRVCGLALYRSSTKFSSGCGWPSFDDDIVGAVKRALDADGRREEILCARCGAHLGHVFMGEGFTDKNTRHCVNAASLDFVHDMHIKDSDEAIFAGGCFWGVESSLQKFPGVVFTEVGYLGGSKNQPTYKEVCTGNTGHVEAVRVIFDQARTSFVDVANYFFTIHDATDRFGQGPDIGSQYLSTAFYYDDEQQRALRDIVDKLRKQGQDIATTIKPVSVFWPAEEYHQDYYRKNNMAPHCR